MSNEYYKRLDRSGETFVKAIGGLVQIAKMHLDNNVLLIDAAEKFIHLVETLGKKEDDVSIMCLDGRLYFQKKKLTIHQANKLTFGRMLMYKDVSWKLLSGKYAGMRNVVRLVQKMVDILSEDESLFSILGIVRIYDDYTYVHSLNVAILSMCLGKNVGLDHIALEKLGLCGLFHDLGKVAVSEQIIKKKGRLDDDEYAEVRKHPVHSARLILKLQARRDRKNKILMAPFEHHMGYNRSGYPRIKTNRDISLFSRIVTIADVYDAITSPRVYRPYTLSSDRALRKSVETHSSAFGSRC